MIPLGDFYANEKVMQVYVKEHEHLPLIMRTFEDMPKSLQTEIKFVEKLDYKMLQIRELYEEMVYRAI